MVITPFKNMEKDVNIYMKNNIIEVQNIKVNVTNMNDNDYFVFLILQSLKKENQHQMI